MDHVDLNADMGESFGPWRMGDDAALLDDEEKNWAWATQGDSSRQTNSKRRVAKNTSNPC